MMNLNMETALYQAATLTFEELGFLFPAPELAEEQRDAATDEATGVDFKGGAASGRFVLKTCRDLRETLAGNLLGGEGEGGEPLSEELQRDALGEFANVICGNALPAIFGRHEVFRLDAPRYFSASAAEAPADGPSAAVRVNLDEGCADVLLYLN